jgi:hypothetical protein
MAVRSLAALLILVAALAVATAPAHAQRKVPPGFFGMMWDGDVSTAPVAVQDQQWARMASSGVEAARMVFFWSTAQPVPGPIDHGRTDTVVRLAASHGITLLPEVDYAPAWARAYRGRRTSPPRDPALYAAYLASLIDRYGPNGTFWVENPDVPRRPIREWQVWNEPHLRTYWDAPRRSRFGHPHGYARLLKVAYRTIKQRDPGAKVVLAGLTQRAWDQLTFLYRRGRIRRFFDVATMQTFPQTASRAVRATRLFRRALNRAGDRRKPIYITEITWPASRGRTKGIEFQRQETPAGMARRLTEAYSMLARARRPLRLARVYWYTWASQYGRGGSIFNYAGLLRYANRAFTDQPALGAYMRSARRLEGCVKDERAACR